MSGQFSARARLLEQQRHNLRILLAWEAGEITIGQAKTLMELWDGRPVDHLNIREMRDAAIRDVKRIWDDEFRDRHATKGEQ